MSKHTGIVASAALRSRIPPARAMPVVAQRARTPGWISAKTVGSFVPGLTRKAFEKHGFSTAALILDWGRIVGDRFAAYTLPQRLKWPQGRGAEAIGEAEAGGRPGATLVLKVDPARALDAEYSAAQIIDRINAYFGYRAVADLRLVQAPVEARQPATGSRQPGTALRVPAVPEPAGSDADARLGAALARLGAGITSRVKRGS